MTDDPKKCPQGMGERVFPVGEVSAERDTLAVRHRADCSYELGRIRLAKPGESMPAGSTPLDREADGSFSPAATGHTGPARVTSDAFRSGWERLFGGKQEVGQA